MMSVHFWGEPITSGSLTWKLLIKNSGDRQADLKAWRLTFYGTEEDPQPGVKISVNEPVVEHLEQLEAAQGQVENEEMTDASLTSKEVTELPSTAPKKASDASAEEVPADEPLTSPKVDDTPTTSEEITDTPTASAEEDTTLSQDEPDVTSLSHDVDNVHHEGSQLTEEESETVAR